MCQRGANALDAIDARTGTSLMNLPPPTSPLAEIEGLVISSDGQRAVGHAGGQLWTWDAAGAHRLVDPPAPLWRPVLLFLATGRLAVVSQDIGGPHVHRYDVDRNAIEASSELRGLTRIIGSPGVLFGERLILDEVHPRGHALTSFDLAGREAARQLPVWIRPADRPRMDMRNESLQAAVTDPVAQRMFIRGDDTRIHAWDLRSGRLVARGPAPGGTGRGLVLTPDRKHLIVRRYPARDPATTLIDWVRTCASRDRLGFELDEVLLAIVGGVIEDRSTQQRAAELKAPVPEVERALTTLRRLPVLAPLFQR